MPYELLLEASARKDLKQIFDYIHGRADARVAEAFVDKLLDHCRKLQDIPELGTRRDDLRPGLRTLGYRRRATILFRVDHSRRVVVVLGIYYGGREFETSFQDEEP